MNKIINLDINKTLKLIIKKFDSQFEKNNNWFVLIEKKFWGSRTKKSIKNIAFFVWYYNQEKIDKFFRIALKTSVLLSAQDDFYDNKRIKYEIKEYFYNSSSGIINRQNIKNKVIASNQIDELLNLWKEIIKNLPSQSLLFNIWKKTAIKMNTAMLKECRLSKTIPFKKYLNISTETIGAKFLWTTYFISKNVSVKTIYDLKNIFKEGAIVARLTNDLASYYRKKNKINAVTIIADKKPKPVQCVKKLIRFHLNNLRKNLKNLKLKKSELWIKPVIWRSTTFLVNFYEHGDFDKFNWKNYHSD